MVDFPLPCLSEGNYRGVLLGWPGFARVFFEFSLGTRGDPGSWSYHMDLLGPHRFTVSPARKIKLLDSYQQTIYNHLEYIYIYIYYTHTHIYIYIHIKPLLYTWLYITAYRMCKDSIFTTTIHRWSVGCWGLLRQAPLMVTSKAGLGSLFTFGPFKKWYVKWCSSISHICSLSLSLSLSLHNFTQCMYIYIYIYVCIYIYIYMCIYIYISVCVCVSRV